MDTSTLTDNKQSFSTNKLAKHFVSSNNPRKLLLIIVGISVILGAVTGYVLSGKGGSGGLATSGLGIPAKNAESDTRTFRDFAEGVIQTKEKPDNPEEYTEGTHTLEREGAVPVALTSSVVDLSQYEGKKVKVYGETQKALKEGWLMDVGKVEEIK